ncbi:hypothetical protein BH10PSE3_BH10PSE3_22800 [soil metagenome]
MPRTRTRTATRDRDPERRPHDPDWPPIRVAQLRRAIFQKMAKFKASREYARMAAAHAAQTAAEQQKAPGLATEGFAKPDEPAWDDHDAYDNN